MNQHKLVEFSKITDLIYLGTNLCCSTIPHIQILLDHGRSPTLLAAYFMSQGLEIDEAIEKIKSKRPQVHLREVQIEALNKFRQRR